MQTFAELFFRPAVTSAYFVLGNMPYMKSVPVDMGASLTIIMANHSR